MSWPVQDYRKTNSHFQSGPRHGLWHSYKKLFIIPYEQQTFFSFLQETLLRWHLNLFQFSFVNESMNLFVSIKPNIQKFTLLIEKLTFQEKQYIIWIFSTKFGFNRSLFKNKAICIRRKIFIFFSFEKKWDGPRLGIFFYIWLSSNVTVLKKKDTSAFIAAKTKSFEKIKKGDEVVLSLASIKYSIPANKILI